MSSRECKLCPYGLLSVVIDSKRGTQGTAYPYGVYHQKIRKEVITMKNKTLAESMEKSIRYDWERYMLLGSCKVEIMVDTSSTDEDGELSINTKAEEFKGITSKEIFYFTNFFLICFINNVLANCDSLTSSS